MEVIRLFVGFDIREAVGSTVFEHSVFLHTTTPVAVTRLMYDGGTMNDRDGTNMFTYRRFLVPYLCRFKGWAIFCDGADMLMRADIAGLWEQRDIWNKAVQVVKHDYKTTAQTKYIGTPMEAVNTDYPRKNWSSVILWNCGHFGNRCLTPEFIASQSGSFLHRFGWLQDEVIGDLSPEWNVLIGETDEAIDAKIAHYTLGIPGFRAYRGARYSDEWFDVLARSQGGLQLEA